MNIKEFNQMLRAIEESTPFEVDFSLQYSEEGRLTLQELFRRIPIASFREFMERVERTKPPAYSAEQG